VFTIVAIREDGLVEAVLDVPGKVPILLRPREPRTRRLERHVAAIRMTARERRYGTESSHRAQLARELAMIAELRALMRESEGPDFHPPTTVPDRLLDQWNRS
jgi:hypothetical protein